MKFYLIRELLEEQHEIENGGLPDNWDPAGTRPFAAVLSRQEWTRYKERFDMGIELEPVSDAHMTKAEVNYDSLTGTFSIMTS